MTATLKAIPQNLFQNSSQGWARRWHRCIAFQGEHFEGDHSDIQHVYRCEFANFIVRPRTLCLDLSGMDGPTRTLLFRQHSSIEQCGAQTSLQR
jgi:hypothetical protein